MRNNPFPNDPLNVHATEAVPPLEDIPLRQVPQTPVIQESAILVDADVEDVDARQEEARTVKFAIGKLRDFLQWFTLVLEVTLLVRFIFKLIGADPANVFAGFLYALTGIILYPFLSIVNDPKFHPNQAFELSTLIGMGIYYLIFWAVSRFLHILISEPEEAAS